MDLLNILASQKEERNNLANKKYVPRDKLSWGKQNLESNLIKIITGPRRAGKSVFCFLLLKGKDFAYINFNDDRLIGLSNPDQLIDPLRQTYGDVKYYLFDEIQTIANWQLFVDRLSRNGKNIILTGSNSKLLNGTLADRLTGRYAEINIFPFSLKEILNYTKTINGHIDQATIQLCLDQYLQNGGYPEIVVNKLEAQTYLRSLFDATINKDVFARHSVRDFQKLNIIANYIASNSGNEFTYRQIANLDMPNHMVKSDKTVRKFLGYLEEAYLMHILGRFSLKQKFQVSLKAPRKTYALDPGMASVMQHSLGPAWGAKLETAVFDTLLNEYYLTKNLYYYHTRNKKEIDFIIKENGKISQLIQVSFSLDDSKTLEREIVALIEASQELYCDDLLIITSNNNQRIERDGKIIKVVSFTNWVMTIGKDLE